jgi:hypothetical protein
VQAGASAPASKEPIMKTAIVKLAVAGLCAGLPLACTADIHDNTADIHDNNADIDDAEVEMSSDTDLDAVQPSQVIQVQVTAEDVFLIDPSETPPSDRVDVAGHFQFYFDTMSSEPILITAEQSVSITLPATATVGDHKLICRVHKHDGSPTQATFELDLKVTASVN